MSFVDEARDKGARHDACGARVKSFVTLFADRATQPLPDCLGKLPVDRVVVAFEVCALGKALPVVAVRAVAAVVFPAEEVLAVSAVVSFDHLTLVDRLLLPATPIRESEVAKAAARIATKMAAARAGHGKPLASTFSSPL